MQSRRAFLQSIAAASAVSALSPKSAQGVGSGAAQSGQAVQPHPSQDMAHAPVKDLVDHFRQMKWLRERLGLKIAYCQHPMYLIIDEDRGVPSVGERIPPWGAVKASDYVQRIRRNLASLERLPALRLNYDFAAVDLEDIGRDFPDVTDQMKRMSDRDLLEFVNGTYSQGHLQLYGAEANWRDFEFGTSVIRELFQKKVKVYAFQEDGLHPQLPQLLRRFGYEFIVAPAFMWFMEIDRGSFELRSDSSGTNFIRGDEFVSARALDGSLLPMYLPDSVPPGGMPGDPPDIESIFDADMISSPPIRVYFPDMEEVDENHFNDLNTFCDFALLEPALRERLKAAPPRAEATLPQHWSYAEGVWAEELLRANCKAEESALLAESTLAMSTVSGHEPHAQDSIRDFWKIILKSHDHDVAWIEVTDLRRKMIGKLQSVSTQANELAREAANTMVRPASNSYSVFNTLSFTRNAVIESRAPDAPGPGFQQFNERVLGVCELPPGGFRSFQRSTPAPSVRRPLPASIQLSNSKVELSSTGLITQIHTKDGIEILRPGEFHGGELRALIQDEWKTNREASCDFYQGPVCSIVIRSSKVGPIPVVEKYFYFHRINAIKVELQFDFSGNEVGYFWFDDSKLAVYFPTSGSDLHHDVPFGFVKAREERPMLAPSWVHSGGLTYVNRGTVKHWSRNGVLGNVLAWGGNRFDNRMDFVYWPGNTQYDLRLYGSHSIEYWLIPHGRFDGAAIVNDVQALTFPTLVVNGSGERSFYQFKSSSLATTAVFEKGGELWARGYRLPTKGQTGRAFEIFDDRLAALE